MTSTATAAQIDYATSLIEQLRHNLTQVTLADRVSSAIQHIAPEARRDAILALGYASPRDASAVVKAEIEAHMVAQRLAETETLAQTTREQVEAMDRAEASALIDTLKGRPW